MVLILELYSDSPSLPWKWGGRVSLHIGWRKEAVLHCRSHPLGTKFTQPFILGSAMQNMPPLSSTISVVPSAFFFPSYSYLAYLNFKIHTIPTPWPRYSQLREGASSSTPFVIKSTLWTTFLRRTRPPLRSQILDFPSDYSLHSFASPAPSGHHPHITPSLFSKLISSFLLPGPSFPDGTLDSPSPCPSFCPSQDQIQYPMWWLFFPLLPTPHHPSFIEV